MGSIECGNDLQHGEFILWNSNKNQGSVLIMIETWVWIL